MLHKIYAMEQRNTLSVICITFQAIVRHGKVFSIAVHTHSLMRKLHSKWARNATLVAWACEKYFACFYCNAIWLNVVFRHVRFISNHVLTNSVCISLFTRPWIEMWTKFRVFTLGHAKNLSGIKFHQLCNFVRCICI